MRVGVEVEEPKTGEAALRTVEPNSPALRSGLQPGDVVLKLDKEPIDCAFSFWKHLAKRSAGDTIVFTVKRGAETLRVPVVADPAPKPSGEKLAETKLGLAVRAITARVGRRRQAPAEAGILVEKVQTGGPGEETGFQAGDVIVQVAGKRIHTLDELGAVLEHARGGQELVVVLIRGEYVCYARMVCRS
jgi:serine protease Do